MWTRIRDPSMLLSGTLSAFLTEKDSQWLVGLIRRLITIGAAYNFLLLPFLHYRTWAEWPDPQKKLAVITALYIAYATVVLTAHQRRWLPSLRTMASRHYWKIGIDVLTFSTMLALNAKPDSDLFLFFIIPLLIAADSLPIIHSLFTLCLIIGAYMATFIPFLYTGTTQGEMSISLLLDSTLTSGLFFMVVVFMTFFLLRLKRDELKTRSDELHIKNQHLDAINSTATSIARGETLQGRLQELIEAARKMLCAKGCIVYLLDRDRLTVVALTGLNDDRFKIGTTLSPNEGLAGFVARTKRPQIANNYPESEYAVPEFTDIFGSVIEVPLINNESLIGILVAFDDPTERQFSQKDVAILELLAGHAAVAISNALERLQQEALRRLAAAGEDIGANLRISDTLAAIARHASKIAGAYGDPPTFSGIWLSDGSELVFQTAFPQDRSDIARSMGIRLSLFPSEDPGILQRVALTGSEEFSQIADMDCNPICTSPALLVLPIKSTSDSVGTLVLEYPSRDTPSEKLVEILKLFSSQATAAIKNAILYERLRRLSEASVHINATTGRKKTAEVILDELQAMFPCDRAILHLLDGHHREAICTRGSFGPDRDPHLNRPISEDSLIKRILEENRACIAPPQEIPEWEDLDSTSDIRLWAGIPLRYRDEHIGFITADRLTPSLPYEYQGQFLSIFGHYTASKLHSVLLNEELEQTNEELEQRVEELEALNETLVDQSNLAMIGLVYGETLHYARAKLGMARTIAADISQGFFNDTPDRLKSEAARIKQLLRDYLEYLKEIQDEALKAPEIAATDVHHLIERVLGRKRVARRQIKIMRDLKAQISEVSAPEKQLTQVFLVIIQNALVAMRNCGSLTLATRNLTWSSRMAIQVSITDTGRGIPKSRMKNLFRLKKAEGRRGAGMGLMWAYSFLRSYDGTIECESEPGLGTTMRVIIPIDFNASKKNYVLDADKQDGKPHREHLSQLGVGTND